MQQKYIRKYRILFIITQGILGGAQIHVRDLAIYLHNSGHNVHVAIGVKGPILNELEANGINVEHIPSLVREISPLKDLQAYQEINGLIRRIKPDLVTSHSSKAGIIGRLVSHRYNIPNIFTAHGWAFTEGVSGKRRRLYLIMERKAASWANRIICVSEYDRNLALKHSVGLPGQLVTIHNGIPILINNSLNRPNKDKIIKKIMVARFSEPKDQQLLLRAASQLQTVTDFEIDFVGDGPLLSATKELARKLQISDKVRFLGARTDVPELLEKAHIFVLTSNWEGFPITILEAMRAGLPVITSDVGGCKEAVIDGITGYLIPKGDAEKLKDRLEILINNAELRQQMGMAGYKRFVEKFTFDRMLKETVKVYEEVLQKHGKI
ncbi:MAG TPA: glycosyltransferase family 1 protein [Clostridiales bacterium]|jgi:glycosyltransferase involved in cell wall biosynthesis|nr:glycosyltransferase family 1 protein [Clostridiales bacterium]